MRKKVMLMSSSLDPRLLCAVEAAKKLGMETVACVREEDNGEDALLMVCEHMPDADPGFEEEPAEEGNDG